MDAIGKYRIVKRLAVGGMGEIFLARERGVAGFDRLVVVKRMLPEMSERADAVALFIDEARIVAHLAHPNIVQVYELGQEADTYFIAMEYVPGENLARICERAVRHPAKPLSRRLAVHIVAELAHGLDFAHRATDLDGVALRIVHRDVSPHNLLLSVHGDVKVMDFGIAKAANKLHQTQTGVVRGKYAYMSPEQLLGRKVDVTSDVYAAGVVLWELTLLRRMFRAKDDMELLDLARAGTFARPTEIDADYPRELEDIVMAALVRDPGERTATAGELASQLRAFLAASGPPISRPELGALVTQLFPEADHLAPARTAPVTTDVATSSMPVKEPTETTTPQAPEIQALTQTAAAELTARAPEPRSPVRGRILGLAAAAVIAAGALVAINVRGSGESERSVVASAAPSDAAAIVEADAAPIAVSVDADVVVAVDAAVVDAGARVAVGKAHPKLPVKPPVTPVEPARIDAGVTPQVAPVATTGTLSVDADGWGTVSGVGIPPNSTTPRLFDLVEGMHDITVTLSEGRGAFQARVRVVAGKRTKCNATERKLVCGSPL